MRQAAMMASAGVRSNRSSRRARSRATPPGSRCPAGSAAAPRPTMWGTFWVPGRRTRVNWQGGKSTDGAMEIGR
jgi:hypothetical protein